MSPEEKPEPRELFNCVQRTRLSHWIHQESSGNDFWLHASFANNDENCEIMAKVNVTRGQARTQGIVQLCPKNTFVTLDSPGELRKWFLIARKFWTTIWEVHNYGKSECHQRTSPNPGNVQLCPKNTFVTLDSPGELRKWFLIACKFRKQWWELRNYGKSECHQRTNPTKGTVCHIGFTRRAQEMISDCMQVSQTMMRTS